MIWMIFIKNIEECNPNKEHKTLIIFYDMMADMFSNINLNSIVTELFIRGRKLNISLVFKTKSYFCCTENLRLNPTLYVIIKTPNK